MRRYRAEWRSTMIWLNLKSVSPEWNARSNQLARLTVCWMQLFRPSPLLKFQRPLRMFSVRFSGCVPLALVLMMRRPFFFANQWDLVTSPWPQMYQFDVSTNQWDKTVRWPRVSQFGWEEGTKHQTRRWFQTFFVFTPIWGRFPFWLIFFRWVETTN